MNNPLFKIEVVDNNYLDVAVKGDKHKVIEMIVDAMERTPEVAEAIFSAANAYAFKNRFYKSPIKD